MMRVRIVLTALLIAACGGGGASGPAPEPGPATPNDAVRRFMQAAADSNLAAMADLWGTDKGSAGRTGEPKDYLKRMQVTQLYLQHIPYKVVRIQPFEDDPRRQQVDVQFDRGSCQRMVPILVVRTDKDGWIVNQIDLTKVGSPTRPCKDASESSPAAPTKQ
jgi:hypothetical protein